MFFNVNDCLYQNKDNSKLNTAVNVLIAIAIIVLILEIFFTISYSGIYVIGQSMNDTLVGAKDVENTVFVDVDGDYVYIKKNVKPDYGNIVVVKKNESTTIIKRVIAKGGDYIKIAEGKVYIKHSSDENFPDTPLVENYVTPERNSPEKNSFHNDEYGYYVKEGYYFLLGDNRNDSLDSRENGGTCYTDKQILGVVADWSLKGKSFFTKLHKFFAFEMPGCFGIDNRVKRTKDF